MNKVKSRPRHNYPPIRTGDDPVLRCLCLPVDWRVDTISLITRGLSQAVMRSKRGVGLSAPQIGFLKRIIVTYIEGQIHIMVNPEIVGWSDSKNRGLEGCLSYPGRSVMVERYDDIHVRYDVSAAAGGTRYFSGFEARVIQHEIDHLNGICAVRPKRKGR